MIHIGRELEQALAAITCCCDIAINWEILHQIERDSREDKVNPKEYVLHDSKHVRLMASVDAYEPETISLLLTRGHCRHFAAIVACASAEGFGKHAFFLDRPLAPTKSLVDVINSARQPLSSKHPVLRMSLVAFKGRNAIVRCFLGGTGIMPAPYLIFAADIRTMSAKELSGDDAKPFTIAGYR